MIWGYSYQHNRVRWFVDRNHGVPAPPLHLRIAKADRNIFKGGNYPLLPTGIGERYSQTISNLGHAGGPLVNSLLWDRNLERIKNSTGVTGFRPSPLPPPPPFCKGFVCRIHWSRSSAWLLRYAADRTQFFSVSLSRCPCPFSFSLSVSVAIFSNRFP